MRKPLARRLQLQREEWFEGDRYETLAICRMLAPARAAFKAVVEEKRALLANHVP